MRIPLFIVLLAVCLGRCSAVDECPAGGCDPIDPECTARRRSFVAGTPIEPDQAVYEVTRPGLGESETSVTVTINAPLPPVQDCDLTATFSGEDAPGSPFFLAGLWTSFTIPQGASSGAFDVAVFSARPDFPCSAEYSFFVIVEGDECCDTGDGPLEVEIRVAPFCHATLETTSEVVSEGTDFDISVITSDPLAAECVVDIDVTFADDEDDFVGLASEQQLSIAAGESAASLSVSVESDDGHEGDETIQIQISAVSGGGCTFGQGVITKTLTIQDGDLPPEVTFSNAAPYFFENSGTVAVDLQLEQASSLLCSVLVSVTADSSGGVAFNLVGDVSPGSSSSSPASSGSSSISTGGSRRSRMTSEIRAVAQQGEWSFSDGESSSARERALDGASIATSAEQTWQAIRDKTAESNTMTAAGPGSRSRSSLPTTTITIDPSSTTGSFELVLIDNLDVSDDTLIDVTISGSGGCSGTLSTSITILDDELVTMSLTDTAGAPVALGTTLPTEAGNSAATVEVGTTHVFRMKLSNDDPRGLSYELVSVNFGCGDSHFSLLKPSSLSLAIEANDDAPLWVQFESGDSDGTYACVVTVSTTGVPSTITFPLSATVVSSPLQVAVSGDGVITTLDPSKATTISVTLVNSGDDEIDLFPDDPLTDAPILLEDFDGGRSSAMYSTDWQPISPTIRPGETIIITIFYQPTDIGRHSVALEIPTNLDTLYGIDGTLMVTLNNRAVAAPLAFVSIAGEPRTTYNAGIVNSPTGLFSTSIDISSFGGQDLTVMSVTSESSMLSIDASVAGAVVHSGDVLVVPVALSLVPGETTTAVIQVATDDARVPVIVVTLSASADMIRSVSVTNGVQMLSLANPLELNAVKSVGAATTTATISNTGNVDLSFSQASVSPRDDMTPTSGTLTLNGLSGPQNLPVGDSVIVSLDYVVGQNALVTATDTFLIQLEFEDMDEPISFSTAVSIVVPAWAPETERTWVLSEGDSLSLDINLPVAGIEESVDLVTIENNEGGDVELMSLRAVDERTVRIELSVVDDTEEEPVETLTINLLDSADPITIAIRASDTTEAIGSFDTTRPIFVSATGFRPSITRDDANENDNGRGTVSVEISADDVSDSSTAVKVVIVEAATDDYEDPNFEVQSGPTTVRTIGTSFAIELNDGVVLTRAINVTASYRCGATDVQLMVFNKELAEPAWVPAASMCTGGASLPVLNESACTAVFTICHLTQFAVASAVVKSPSPTVPPATSGSVDESSSGSKSTVAEDGGLPAGWVVLIVLLSTAAIFAGALTILRRSKPGAVDEETCATVSDFEMSDDSSTSSAFSSSASAR